MYDIRLTFDQIQALYDWIEESDPAPVDLYMPNLYDCILLVDQGESHTAFRKDGRQL